MKRIPCPTFVVVMVALIGSATAHASISGTLRNPAGIALNSVSMTLVAADGTETDFRVSGHDGAFTLVPGIGSTGPYKVRASENDPCRPFGDPARAQAVEVPGVADGTTGLPVTIDLLDFCVGQKSFSAPAGSPDATALIDGARRRIVGGLGAVAFVRVRYSSSAGPDPRITLQDGTRVSAPLTSSFDDLQLTAPAAGYDGPLLFVYDTSGGPVSRNMGTLTSRIATIQPPSTGVPYDVEAIVDVSGSMGGTDPKFLRKDALNLLADLSGTADGLGAVGFDDEYQPIFDLTQTTSQAIVNQLKAKVKTQVINRGSTDYNVGMDRAFDALTAGGVDPNKPKMIIFLTDGAHNGGTYNNGHLRFAMPGVFNSVTQRSWPVCAVQLGDPTIFQADDVARLKRIASETGGKYFATKSSASLNDIYFTCRGQSTGQQAILTKNVVLTKAGQQKQFVRRLGKGLKQATFFVNSGGTFRFQMTLVDPKGRRFTRTTKRTGLAFRSGSTFQFFRITKPQAGNWRIIVKAVKIVDATGRGQVTISVPTK